MKNYAVIQSRGDMSFMVAVFMTSFDAHHYVERENKGGTYSFDIVEIPHSDLWNDLENAAIKEKG